MILKVVAFLFAVLRCLISPSGVLSKDEFFLYIQHGKHLAERTRAYQECVHWGINDPPFRAEISFNGPYSYNNNKANFHWVGMS